MTKEKFDVAYAHKGGVAQIKNLMKQNESIEGIGVYFGVCKNAVRLWCREMFGENYDPRKNRRDKVVNEMIKFAERHTQTDFRQEYIKQSKYYYHMALARCYSQGIYQK